MDERLSGLVLAIGCFTYAFGCPIVAVLCTKFERKYITWISFLLCSLSLLILGPSNWMLGMGKSLPLTLIGWALLSFACSFIFVPLLPEIIECVSKKAGLENSPFLADKASAIYNAAYGLGSCIAPIVGGSISDFYGYRPG